MGIVWYRKSTYLAAGFLALALLLVSLFFALQKPVAIQVDGKTINTRIFFTSTVGEVLHDQNIKLGERDKVEPGLNSIVKKNTEIKVIRAFKVKVFADGEIREVFSTPVSVKEAIRLSGFELGEKDIIKTRPGNRTVPGQEIELIRVTEQTLDVKQEIPYGVEKIPDNTLEKGLTRTVKTGKNGIAQQTVKVVYHNGQEVKREVIKSQTLVEPQNKVIAMGNITSVSRGGARLNFREARYMLASAYTYTGSHTATGKQPAVGTVAVDTRIIPLGSRLYVEGYGYAVAGDTGGSIKGDCIDVFMETRQQCLNWGRRTVKVYVLN